MLNGYVCVGSISEQAEPPVRAGQSCEDAGGQAPAAAPREGKSREARSAPLEPPDPLNTVSGLLQHTLETALLSASQELSEQNGSNAAAVQNLIQQRDVLQNGLLSTCRELSRVSVVSPPTLQTPRLLPVSLLAGRQRRVLLNPIYAGRFDGVLIANR